MNDVRGLLGLSYAAANQRVDRLVATKVLEEMTGQTRNRHFRCAAYIGLSDEADASRRPER